jgi:hypothetical protein
LEGIIALIGFVGGPGKNTSPLDPLTRVCTVRGIYVGSRQQQEDMNAAIEVNNIKPVVDKHVFDFEHATDAYQYMLARKHFGEWSTTIFLKSCRLLTVGFSFGRQGGYQDLSGRHCKAYSGFWKIKPCVSLKD